jgi:hypothetical protein
MPFSALQRAFVVESYFLTQWYEAGKQACHLSVADAVVYKMSQ